MTKYHFASAHWQMGTGLHLEIVRIHQREKKIGKPIIVVIKMEYTIIVHNIQKSNWKELLRGMEE